MKKGIVCMTAAFLLISAAVAAAENKAETFSLTPFLGGYTFDGKQHLETAPVVGIRGGYNFTDRFGTEAVFDYVRTEGTKDKNDYDVYNYHLDLLYHFFPSARAVPFLMAGFGGITVDPEAGSKVSKGAFNYGAGVKYALNESLELRGEVRHILFKTSETLSNVEYGIGLGFLFGGAKPAPAPVVAPAPPPPAPIAVLPAVPDGSLSVSPDTVTKGQAATLNWACRNSISANIQPDIGPVPLQGSQLVNQSTNTVYTLTCAGQGGQATKAANLTVTPLPAPTATISVAPDMVIKGQDAILNWSCLNSTTADIQPGIGSVPTHGTRSVTPDATTPYNLICTGQGGEATGQAALTVNPLPPEKHSIALDLEFDTARAEIKKKYHDEIGRVAEFLKTYPTVNGVIEGHTDNVGSAEMNQKLSQRRAESVRKYLIDKYGIAPDRLTAKGFGMTRPIADNKTPEGRQKNRRTVAEFDTVVTK